MMNTKKVLVMMTLLNIFQIKNMYLILRMGFHPEITTNRERKYWLCGRGIKLYYSMIILGQYTCCLWIPIHMHMKR